MDATDSKFCKNCGHTKEDHKGTAMICLKQVGKGTGELCDCCWFDDGKAHLLTGTFKAFVLKKNEPVQEEMKSDDSKREEESL